MIFVPRLLFRFVEIDVLMVGHAFEHRHHAGAAGALLAGGRQVDIGLAQHFEDGLARRDGAASGTERASATSKLELSSMIVVFLKYSKCTASPGQPCSAAMRRAASSMRTRAAQIEMHAGTVGRQQRGERFARCPRGAESEMRDQRVLQPVEPIAERRDGRSPARNSAARAAARNDAGACAMASSGVMPMPPAISSGPGRVAAQRKIVARLGDGKHVALAHRVMHADRAALEIRLALDADDVAAGLARAIGDRILADLAVRHVHVDMGARLEGRQQALDRLSSKPAMPCAACHLRATSTRRPALRPCARNSRHRGELGRNPLVDRFDRRRRGFRRSLRSTRSRSADRRSL